jgi:multicomponent K+:H+ antiporter subunit E
MNSMGRALLHPVLSASLLVIWLVLNASLQPGQILLGALLGLALPLLTRPFGPDRPPFHRLPLLWRLFLIVNWDTLKASLTVTRLTLTRLAHSLQPRFMVVPLDCRDPYGMAILAGIVSITPGTVARPGPGERAPAGPRPSRARSCGRSRRIKSR